jgi:VAD1 Analog of StAR-related lipid transfer domain
MAFLSPQSRFWTAYHEGQGHQNIRLDRWQRHFKVGNVRDLRFVSIFKGWRGGQQQALCHQTQRYQVYRDDHLVFETSQVMSDIPYSDHFSVETRWDVTPEGGVC